MHRRLTSDGFRLSHKKDAYCHPHIMEVTRHDEAITAIIAAATEDRDAPRLEVRILLPQDAGNLGAGILHEDLAGNAVGVDGQPVKLPHFRCRRDAHRPSPSRRRPFLNAAGTAVQHLPAPAENVVTLDG